MPDIVLYRYRDEIQVNIEGLNIASIYLDLKTGKALTQALKTLCDDIEDKTYQESRLEEQKIKRESSIQDFLTGKE